MGVLLLLNKRSGESFTSSEEYGARNIAETLGDALHRQFQAQKRQATAQRTSQQLSLSQELHFVAPDTSSESEPSPSLASSIASSEAPDSTAEGSELSRERSGTKGRAAKRLGKFDQLLTRQLINAEDLSHAMSEARRKGCDVETVLLETYRVPKAELGEALSYFYGCPFVEYSEHTVVDRSLLKDLNFEFLKANYWLPLRRTDDTIEVLVDNPKDLLKTGHIQMLLRGAPLRWLVGLRKDILQYLASATGRQTELGSIQDILGELSDELTADDEDDTVGGIGENDSTIVRLANQVIVDAYKRGASDIHIEPYAARTDTVIRIRIDGSCLEYQRIPASYRRALVSRLKIMARLDIAERRKPQDGKIKFRLPQGRDIELRVATIPTAQGDEDVVMRILAASEPLPLDALRMTERNLRELQRLIDLPYGLFLVVGPTGSGKTTTLHAALGSINTPDLKIWTAEDPVEITQYGLRQVQVQPRIGFTFAAAMRAFLRADPDVIMVGEMRDEETAHTGIEASLTGHLVFSTLHTNSAPETITRLLDMGLDPFNFADALLGVLAQRLARTICKGCKAPYLAPEAQYEELRQAYGAAAFDTLGVAYTPEFQLYRGVGCAECNNTGYRGRVGLHELLVATPEIKRLIQQRARIAEVAACAQGEGMTTLLQDGVLKVLQGVTDIIQVKAVASK
ncbi:MAG: type II/IV secretion system protein [Candidatus Tectomicrobia bacterium]|uniref:Type II/IV secretion system protein n=1 Tax=Tectimicrobiota bacterium TaxID=2528274 RepID=A0A938AZI5_UNCTE|nr:type II/IV secretion system protein [Candidatus Tectomicrobia bacterium]